MWADGVVVPAPVLDDHFGFLPVAEPLLVEALVTEASVETFFAAILPRFARCNEGRIDVLHRQPA